jgi:hypothetical protein
MPAFASSQRQNAGLIFNHSAFVARGEILCVELIVIYILIFYAKHFNVENEGQE